MSLPWIKVANDMLDHPKTLHLQAVLRDERAWCYVVRLWLWASKHSPDGDLGRFRPEVVEAAMQWTGDPGLLIDALEECGFLDGLSVAGWEKHQGAHIKKRERDRARLAASRGDVARQSRDVATSRGDVAREREREREIEIPLTGGAGGSTANAASPARKARSPKSHKTLAEATEGRIEGWAQKFPQIDGRNGRPTLEECLENAWDHSARKKRTDMPRYLESWLRREAQHLRPQWERDARQAPDEGSDWWSSTQRGLSEVGHG